MYKYYNVSREKIKHLCPKKFPGQGFPAAPAGKPAPFAMSRLPGVQPGFSYVKSHKIGIFLIVFVYVFIYFLLFCPASLLLDRDDFLCAQNRDAP